MFGNTGNFGYNNNNNQFQEKMITSPIKMFFGETTCLRLRYWNDNLSIQIHPLMMISEEGIKKYDMNKKGSTALTSDKCFALKAGIDRTILPKIKEVKETGKLDKPVNVAVTTKGIEISNKIVVEYKNDENGIPFVYLHLYLRVPNATGIAQEGNTYTYKFNKAELEENYNPEDGSSIKYTEETEFEFFYDKIKCHAAIQGVVEQGVKTVNAYKRDNNYSNHNGGQNSYNSGSYNKGPLAEYTGLTRTNNPVGGQTTAFSNSSSYKAPMSDFDSEELPFN